MKKNYTIKDIVYLEHKDILYDLHNDYSLKECNYIVEKKEFFMKWVGDSTDSENMSFTLSFFDIRKTVLKVENSFDIMDFVGFSSSDDVFDIKTFRMQSTCSDDGIIFGFNNGSVIKIYSGRSQFTLIS